MARAGIVQLEDRPGDGAAVERQHVYRVRIKMWLNKGEAIRWQHIPGLADLPRPEDDGSTLVADLRIDRENLIAGLLQGIEGMRVGGRRKLKISPHLAYGANGIAGIIPPDAVILAEIEFIEERNMRNDANE